MQSMRNATDELDALRVMMQRRKVSDKGAAEMPCARSIQTNRTQDRFNPAPEKFWPALRSMCRTQPAGSAAKRTLVEDWGSARFQVKTSF